MLLTKGKVTNVERLKKQWQQLHIFWNKYAKLTPAHAQDKTGQPRVRPRQRRVAAVPNPLVIGRTSTDKQVVHLFIYFCSDQLPVG